MTAVADAAVRGAEREALRERLRTNRRLVARRLAPGRGKPVEFPRSMTMRLLIQRPTVARGSPARSVMRLLGSREFRELVLSVIGRLAARVLHTHG